MREILFRGKKRCDAAWVYGGVVAALECDGERVVRISTDDFYYYSRGVGMGEEYGYEPAQFNVYPESVGQFTGLYDKNGKRVFEGDVVTFKTRASSFKPCYVRWYEEDARFLATMPDGVHSYPLDKSWEYEVIGNIHDNPQLLGG